MSFLSALRRRPHPDRLRQEIDEELAFHVAATADELVAQGWSPAGARAEAERRLGSRDHLRAACLHWHAAADPHLTGDATMALVWQDMKYGARALARRPGFAATAILTLAIGIGANTAVFSVVNAVLLRPLPYPDPDRLVMVWENRRDLPVMSVAYPNYEDWRAQATRLETLAVYRRVNLTLTGSGDPERVPGAMVSATLFPTLGIAPTVGRGLAADDDRPGAARIAVIGHALWQQRFGGSPDVVGRTLHLDQVPHTVIGVMPEGFEFPSRVQAYVAIGTEAGNPDWQERGNHPGIFGVARLGEAVTVEEAQAEMDQIAAALGAAYPETNRDSGIALTPMAEVVTGEARPSLLALMGAVALVLLLACANMANLLLGRGQSRLRELAVRASLGATRGRLVRQLLGESLVLALAGAVAGALLAMWATPTLLAVYPGAIPRSDTISFDVTVLAFTAVIALVAALLFGILPSWQLSASTSASALTERAGTAAPRTRLAQSALVVSQVAAALVLMVGAGLLVRSIAAVLDEPSGLQPDGVYTFKVTLPEDRYDSHEARSTAIDRLVERVAAVPGVTGAAITTELPMVDGSQTSVFARGNPPANMTDRPLVEYAIVSAGYFSAMGIPLRRGRVLGPEDRDGSPRAIVVDENFARFFWPGEDPLGQQIVRGREDVEENRWTVVGVVGAVRFRALDEPAPRPQMYFSHRQRSEPTMTIVTKAEAASTAIAPAVRRAILEVDPLLPAYDVAHMADTVAGTTAPRRMNTLLLSAFALLAAILAVIGTYGVISFGVTERRQEFGVRLALGATPSDLRRQVLGRGLRLAGLGIALGLGGAVLFTRLLEGLLYGVRAIDPLTYVAVALGLTLVIAAACLLPARRATRVDPLTSLRAQ